MSKRSAAARSRAASFFTSCVMLRSCALFIWRSSIATSWSWCRCKQKLDGAAWKQRGKESGKEYYLSNSPIPFHLAVVAGSVVVPFSPQLYVWRTVTGRKHARKREEEEKIKLPRFCLLPFKRMVVKLKSAQREKQCDSPPKRVISNVGRKVLP